MTDPQLGPQPGQPWQQPGPPPGPTGPQAGQPWQQPGPPPGQPQAGQPWQQPGPPPGQPGPPPGPQPSYVGEHVQIGAGRGGMKPIAQNGTVVIINGTLQLIGTHGQLLDQAPVNQVTIRSAKASLGAAQWLTLADRRYSVSVGAGGWMLLTGVIRLFKGSAEGKKLTAALAAEQQRFH